MKAVLFLGPTLPRERVPASVPAGVEILPPAGQGDVLRALAKGATHLGIVDGYFDQVPSVWHKEILFAIEQGAVVYGSSSMGALRAAELHTLGMIGVGRIFELYRDGVLEDDDEVALIHAPESSGYRAVSEAMVNIRDRMDAAVAAGVLGRKEADALVLAVKSLPYSQRSYRQLLALANEVDRAALSPFFKLPHTSLKERDALALIDRMFTGAPDAPAKAPLRVERTVFLERLRHEVRRETWATDPVESRHLPVEETPTDEDVDLLVREFRIARDLLTPEAMLAWLGARGMSEDRFFDLAREEATLRKLEDLYLRSEAPAWDAALTEGSRRSE